MSPLPCCGYFQIFGENSIEHCYLTDFGYVLLDGPPAPPDSAFFKKMQQFSRAQWESGLIGPWHWPDQTLDDKVGMEP